MLTTFIIPGNAKYQTLVKIKMWFLSTCVEHLSLIHMSWLLGENLQRLLSLSFSNGGRDTAPPGHLLGTIAVPLAPPAVSNQQMHCQEEGSL